jgi:hypothetical protein
MWKIPFYSILVSIIVFASDASAHGRLGSHRIGGLNSHGLGSHYVGGRYGAGRERHLGFRHFAGHSTQTVVTLTEPPAAPTRISVRPCYGTLVAIGVIEDGIVEACVVP